MKIVLRGEIRASFTTYQLREFLRYFLDNSKDLEIYIHTYNIAAIKPFVSMNDHKPQDLSKVDEKRIRDYLDEDIWSCVKHVIIEDPYQVELHGNLKGKWHPEGVDRVAWKRYWRGKYEIIRYMFHKPGINPDDFVMNTRFDICGCAWGATSYQLQKHRIIQEEIEYKPKQHYNPFRHHIFPFAQEEYGMRYGVDNLYLGSVRTMFRLAHAFYYNVDQIYAKYDDLRNQEFLVILEDRNIQPKEVHSKMISIST
jgi:hypothetical protein